MRGTMVAVAAVVILAPAAAHAAEIRPYSAQAFAAAQRSGRPILVDVYADWCPTCRAQQQVFNSLLGRDEFNDLVFFRLNFDKQSADWKRFGVRQQSTLIVFHGKREIGRAVGVTDSDDIHQILRASFR